MTGPVARADLEELLRYALLKVPPLTRAAMAGEDPGQRRTAEAMVAERIMRDMRHLEVSGPPGAVPRRPDRSQPPLPLPGTEADLLS